MEKLSFKVRYFFLNYPLVLALLSVVCVKHAIAESNVSTLFSSDDPFYRITLYRENYILPFHRLHQTIPPQPIEVEWIQPIMNTRIEKRGSLDKKKQKETLLLGKRRGKRNVRRMPTRAGTLKHFNRTVTVKKSQRKNSQRKNSHKEFSIKKGRRMGGYWTLDPKKVPPIPPTPDTKTPISPEEFFRQGSSPTLDRKPSSQALNRKGSTPMLRQQRSFTNNYFDSKLVQSPVVYSGPASVQQTPIEKLELDTLHEGKVMPGYIKSPISAVSGTSPLEERLKAIKSPISATRSPLEEKLRAIDTIRRMDSKTYAKLVGIGQNLNPSKKPSISQTPTIAKQASFSKEEEKMQEALNKLVHIIADRPYYDYMVEDEVAFQISFKVPLFYIKSTDTRFYAAYTQQSWWQTKTSISAFFRETNFMPEFFVEQPFITKPGWRPQVESLKIGGIHQSNGEGLEWERSWNRLFLEVCLKCGPFQMVLEPWWVLSTKDRATYNPDIEEYLGYWRLNLNFQHKFFQCNLQKQKSSYKILASVPILPALNLTFFYFSGKGSTLSLYKEHNSSWGIGIGTKV